MKVKVCGITNFKDALLCEHEGSDMLGFIFYRKSRRFVEPVRAEEIIRKLSIETLKVGVFVNESAETINNIAEKLKLNLVQLHGDETPEEVSKIYFPVIKSFRMKEGFDFSALNRFSNIRPLLDSFTSEEFGGTGINFNWQVIPQEVKKRIILAGGISAPNVGYVYNKINPYAVDLSSSLESEPGKKDPDKIHEFFNVLKSLEEPGK